MGSGRSGHGRGAGDRPPGGEAFRSGRAVVGGGSVTVFDKHRTGTIEGGRRCLAAAAMVAAGMSQNERGFWVTRAFHPDTFTA